MLVSTTKKPQVDDVCNKLMSAWSDEELEKISSKPEFIIALCSMLSASIIDYVRESTHEMEEETGRVGPT